MSFAFGLPSGERVHLTLDDILRAQRFAETIGIAKLRSAHWWARTDQGDGCLLQNGSEEPEDLSGDD